MDATLVERDDLAAPITGLPNKSPSDHALAAVKAALSLVPIVGGSIASLIADHIPMSTQRSLEVAVGEVVRVRAVEHKSVSIDDTHDVSCLPREVDDASFGTQMRCSAGNTGINARPTFGMKPGTDGGA